MQKQIEQGVEQMNQEIVDAIEILKSSIKQYEQQLKGPAWKYTFDKEDSHDIARRIIASNKKQLNELLED